MKNSKKLCALLSALLIGTSSITAHGQQDRQLSLCGKIKRKVNAVIQNATSKKVCKGLIFTTRSAVSVGATFLASSYLKNVSMSSVQDTIKDIVLTDGKWKSLMEIANGLWSSLSHMSLDNRMALFSGLLAYAVSPFGICKKVAQQLFALAKTSLFLYGACGTLKMVRDVAHSGSCYNGKFTEGLLKGRSYGEVNLLLLVGVLATACLYPFDIDNNTNELAQNATNNGVIS